MNRYQVFDVPHKALRLAFSNLLNLAGKTDFAIPQDIVALKKLMEEVFSLVYSHSHHEDDICFLELDKYVPNATAHDRAEHIKLHATLDKLMEQISTISQAVNNGQDGSIAGRALYTDLCILHANMLNHFMEEETDTQSLCWQYMTDDELKAFEPRIMAAMTPEMSMLWLKYILPTKSEKELVEMLTGMQQTAPRPVFDATMNLAERVLAPAEYEKLQTVFGLVEMA
ncbi:MAG: hemerythrin domain-containing protein [Saprospiraceae bacterium]|nr:hemerythrin domain-containing protein [Saprospiraceae bacterium]MCF8249599.1 hemerythrin domain-containing protein [Saprospiraceae bacterium]MCF8280499.1 hemerythrin domain-containing protein [Bacteroidales bacterium]MCF8310431.1 hemerythrin domain-containing protein [Saprospiraceae bacterium]MCF8439809.1 hemerythrin domain-containing protein [Saprospiraceae bacterium]